MATTTATTTADESRASVPENEQDLLASLFVEVLPPPPVEVFLPPRYVDAYVAGDVDPQLCGRLVKRLSQTLPLQQKQQQKEQHPSGIDLSHLKRVRRSPTQAPRGEETEQQQEAPSSSASASGGATNEKQEEEGKAQAIVAENGPISKKRRRTTTTSSNSNSNSNSNGSSSSLASDVRLEVVLGEVRALDRAFPPPPRDGGDQTTTTADLLLKEAFAGLVDGSSIAAVSDSCCGGIYRVRVPGRPPESRQEWEEFRAVWPTAYYPMRGAEFREEERRLTATDILQMKRGLEEALMDAVEFQKAQLQRQPSDIDDASETPVVVVGTVIVSPESGEVVARSSAERKLQQGTIDNIERRNPLATSVLLAIQGVSRRERQAAIRHQHERGMDSPAFQNGQYLCTGYDVYTTLEPPVFEAMALVHSRIRRLVFGCSSLDVVGTAAAAGGGWGGGITESHVHSLPGTNHKYRAFACRKDSDLWKRCQQLNSNDHRQLLNGSSRKEETT